MSERIRINKETGHNSEHLRDHSERITRHHESQAKNSRHEHQSNIDNIMNVVEKNSLSKKELEGHAKPKDADDGHRLKHGASDQLAGNTLKQSLRKVRRDLKPRERVLSKVIHNTAVEKVSEAAADTVARPSGLLFGGIASFIVSVAVMWACRYYGYEYNYYLGLLSFIGGFLIGITGEILIKPLRRN